MIAQEVDDEDRGNWQGVELQKQLKKAQVELQRGQMMKTEATGRGLSYKSSLRRHKWSYRGDR